MSNLWRLTKTLAWSLLFAAGCLSCIHQPSAKLVPEKPKEPYHVAWELVIPERVAAADGVSVGWITKLEEDWQYDDICGTIAAAFRGCQGTTTFRFKVDPMGKWIWSFAPNYGYMPLFVGDSAVFIWKKIAISRYKQCREQSAMQSDNCPTDIVPTVTSDLDVLPFADSSRVDSLWHRSHT